MSSVACTSAVAGAQTRLTSSPAAFQYRGLQTSSQAGRATADQSISPDAQSSWGRNLKAAVLIAPAILAAFLGSWQVNRYGWKVDLLEQRAKALEEEPLRLANGVDTPAPYTQVLAQGEYAHERSLYIGPRPRSAMGTTVAGYSLVTPLLPDEWGRAALVMRGWVPAAWRTDPAMREGSEPQGQVCVEGVIRSNDNPSMFVPANDSAQKQFFWIEVPALAAACGLPEDTPMIEVIDKGSKGAGDRGTSPSQMDVLAMRTQGRTRAGVPVEPLPITRCQGDLLRQGVTPTDHRNYALTWFTLSGFTSFMALRILRGRLQDQIVTSVLVISANPRFFRESGGVDQPQSTSPSQTRPLARAADRHMQRERHKNMLLATFLLVQLAVASAATPNILINLPHKSAPIPAPDFAPAPAPAAHTPAPALASLIPRKQAPADAPALPIAANGPAMGPTSHRTMAPVPAPMPAPTPAPTVAPKMAPAPAPTVEAPVSAPAVPQAAQTAVQATLQLTGNGVWPFDQDKAAMLVRALAKTLTSVNPSSINVLNVAGSSNSRRLQQSNSAVVIVEMAGASHMSASDIIAQLQTVISNGSLLQALQAQGLNLSQVQIVVADPASASSDTINCPNGAVSSICIDGGSSGISMAAIIGIAIGGGVAVVFVVALTALLAYWCCLGRRQRSTPSPTSTVGAKDIPMAHKEISGPGTTSTSWFRRARRGQTTSDEEQQSSATFPSVDSSVFPDASGLQRDQHKGIQLTRKDSGDMLEDAFQLVFGNKGMQSPFDSDSCSESEKLRRDSSGHASQEDLTKREQSMESSSSLPSALSLK
ncbi:hypothetical protein WJX73_010878 [Symbiochloris irregularis]|uniref:SURF1-like protein n=1 Tax=Symbiochloris irregularis TaxID=706552 RepID=A0AAW1NP84_9CHLO